VQLDLITLPGVGRKVADCVALFSMRQTETVPVDTHVWDIVLRDYSSYVPARPAQSPAKSPKAPNPNHSPNPTLNTVIPTPERRKGRATKLEIASPESIASPSSIGKETKTLTPYVYDSIGNAFRAQFRSYAGWAHSVLFAAELPAMRVLLPMDLQTEMELFAAGKSAEKQEERERARKRKAREGLADAESTMPDTTTSTTPTTPTTPTTTDTTITSPPTTGRSTKKGRSKA
jgi:hypothetical protein